MNNKIDHQRYSSKYIELLRTYLSFPIAEKLYDNKSLLRLTNFLYTENTSRSNSQAKARTDFFRSKSFCVAM